ncbi:MAG: hypothetical protein A2431_00980 [Candidatus Zambryskibacteria bacterium RIFOXYC1_FULL_39_10]|uniref:Uncharacterized protein n=1 Tax=Candidatus Zambryskibacteria bacterium RIFOXYC1_FULL_39_10 TaxID=1802779 RepID=A0A1G2V2G3_9BACT|nr:MAG: hypothetical protein A2431_00980 [Candidatus Zambryskibacteria bacterium RIFOXYC1_FULL_39_10]OHB16873.1 MAG: hypothetical protein A2605_00190 [Candidatus Zambryskibacteria bacterium RIFOXYD1_FULL_39_35]
MENLDQKKKIRHEIENEPYFEEIHRKNLEFAKRIYTTILEIEPTTREVLKMSLIVQNVEREKRKLEKELENSSSLARLASGPDPIEDLGERILSELYGVTHEEIVQLFPKSEDESENEKNKELKRKYFRRKQAELYR